MTMPAQKPGTSEQTVCTPRAFLNAVESRFGKIAFDLAATQENAVTGDDQFFGPGSPWANDSLTADWSQVYEDELTILWCNPPYGMIKGNGFARKARKECAGGDVRVVMLIPAAVATNWFAEEVHGHALVIPIRPRLTFVGHRDPFPKDLMLCCYGIGRVGFEPWQWNAATEARELFAL